MSKRPGLHQVMRQRGSATMHRRLSSSWLTGTVLVGGALIAMATSGCEASEYASPNPAPIPEVSGGQGGATNASSSSSAAGQGGSGGAPVEKVRTVENRALLGGPAGNLLIDGDFETSIIVQGYGSQIGWLLFNGGQPGYIRSATGGHCRSGLRCAYLPSGAFLYGKGVSANNAPMDAQVWAKLPEGRACGEVAAYVGRCNFGGKLADLSPTSEAPDESGWCSYQGTVGKQVIASCMFVENVNQDPAAAPVIIDAASILPSTGVRQPVKMTRRTGERVERFRRASDYDRRRRPFGRLPGPPKMGAK